MIEIAVAIFLGAAVEPDAYVLNTDEPVWDTAAEDFDGDGMKDVLALCSDDESDPLVKYVAVFLTGASGAYPESPSAILHLDHTIGTVFLAEVDGEAPKEIVVADHGWAGVYRFAGDHFERTGTTTFASLLPYGAKEPVFLRNAAIDLDGDGIDEWLIPVPIGYEIHHVDGRVAVIRCDVESEVREVGSLYITHKLPAYDTYETSADHKKNLVFLSDEYADFAFGENWQEHKRFRVPKKLDDNWSSSARLDDIDGDGLPDLVVTRTKGTVNLTAVTHVYLAEGPIQYPDEPSSTIETKGALTAPTIVDVDGDEKLDLVFVGFPINIRSVLNYFLRRKVTVRISVHRFEDGGYAEKPTFRKSFTLDAPEGREQVAFTAGDFNGDGLLDAAFGNTGDELTVYEGDVDVFLKSRPLVKLELPTFGIARDLDLDGNGRDDIVIMHPTGEHKRRIEVIVF